MQDVTLEEYKEAFELVVGVMENFPTALGDYFTAEQYKLIQRCRGYSDE